MDTLLLDELACARLMIEWTRLIDRHEVDAVVQLFVADAVLHGRNGETLVGHDQIRAALLTRDIARVTRHVIAPPSVRLSGNEATGMTDFVVYDGFRSDAAAAEILPVTHPATVGEFHQSYRRVGRGWLIASHRSAPVFRRIG